MTFLNKLKDRLHAAQDAAEHAAEQVASLVVPNEIKTERMDICNSCEFLFKPTMQCKQCFCFVHAKTSMALSSCPLDKWEIHVDKST